MTRLFAGTPFDIPPRCETCNELESQCVCSSEVKSAIKKQRDVEAARLQPGEQTARVGLEKRKGKRLVTVIGGLASAANDLPDLLAILQKTCGTGGTVKAKEDRVELQGDHVETVNSRLRELGYKVVG